MRGRKTPSQRSWPLRRPFYHRPLRESKIITTMAGEKELQLQMIEREDGKALNPAKLTPEEAAEILELDVSVIRRDIEAGLPTNEDGTLSLVVYAAWLNKMREE